VHGGLGLGLSIVKQLVEAHSGIATAQSAGEGRGAAFVVRLPIFHGRVGVAGFDLLQRQHVDVLLADVAMPGEDGYALIRKVRALDPRIALIPARRTFRSAGAVQRCQSPCCTSP
jgi:CheY-like chemotaxis protein